MYCQSKLVRPIQKTQTHTLYHLNTRLVRYSDGYCIYERLLLRNESYQIRLSRGASVQDGASVRGSGRSRGQSRVVDDAAIADADSRRSST